MIYDDIWDIYTMMVSWMGRVFTMCMCIYIYMYSYIVYTCTLDCPCCIGFNGSACSANKVVECCSNCPYMMGTLHDIMDMKPIIWLIESAGYQTKMPFWTGKWMKQIEKDDGPVDWDLFVDKTKSTYLYRQSISYWICLDKVPLIRLKSSGSWAQHTISQHTISTTKNGGITAAWFFTSKCCTPRSFNLAISSWQQHPGCVFMENPPCSSMIFSTKQLRWVRWFSDFPS